MQKKKKRKEKRVNVNKVFYYVTIDLGILQFTSIKRTWGRGVGPNLYIGKL